MRPLFFGEHGDLALLFVEGGVSPPALPGNFVQSDELGER